MTAQLSEIHLVPLVVTADAISLTGSAVYGVSEPHDLDVIVRSTDRLPEVERALKEFFPNWECHYIYETKGPSTDYIPIGDFILEPLTQSESIRVTNSDVWSFVIDSRYFTRFQQDGKERFRINSKLIDFGLQIKIERLLRGSAEIIFSHTPVDGEEAIGRLVFKPRDTFNLVTVDEPSFKPYYGMKPESAPLSTDDLLEAISHISFGKWFPPVKVGAFGYSGKEVFSIDDAWNFWGQSMLSKGNDLVGEEKFDGNRMQFHVDVEHHKVDCFSEGASEKGRSGIEVSIKIPAIVKDALAHLHCKNCILDTEIVKWEGDMPLRREETTSLLMRGSVEEGADTEVHVNCFDLVWLNGEDLSEKGYLERKKLLKQVLPHDTAHFYYVDHKNLTDKKSFYAAYEHFSNLAGSEGMMVKTTDWKYPLSGKTPFMTKVKHLFEIDVQIIGRKKIPAAKSGSRASSADMLQQLPGLLSKSHTWTLRCAYKGKDGKLHAFYAAKKYSPSDLNLRWNEGAQTWQGTEDPKYWEMAKGWENSEPGAQAYGNTYSFNAGTGGDPRIGAIVTVAPIQVRSWKSGGEDYISWDNPRPRNLKPEKHEPDDYRVIESIMSAISKRHLVKASDTGIMGGIMFEEDIELTLEDLVETHSRLKCMQCDKPPTVEILWAEGMAHAWFCDKHFEDFKNEDTDMTKTGKRADDIVAVRKLKYGLASNKWSDGVPTKAEAVEAGTYTEACAYDIWLEEAFLLEVHQPFASAAGKYFMANKLIQLIPPHKRYVEPFAGAAALLYRKEPSTEEVISDMNPELIFAHKAVKSLTDADIQTLKGKYWTGTPAMWERMKKFRPVTKMDKLYKFFYVTRHSYGSARVTRGLSSPPGPSWFENLKDARERLKNVTILNQDAFKTIPEYDSADTFFYIDPPYRVSYATDKKIGQIDWERMAKLLAGIKGKFLLSVDNDPYVRKIFGRFHMRKIETRHMAVSNHGHGDFRPSIRVNELLFSNYDIGKNIKDSFESPDLPEEFFEADKAEPRKEANREVEEKVLGDIYMIRGTKKVPFVVQTHLRGIWTEDERKQALSDLKGAKDQKEFDNIWRDYDCSYLTKPLADWQSEINNAASKAEDVSGIARRYLTDSPPDKAGIEWERVVNEGNAHDDLRIRHPAENHLIGWTITSGPRIAIQHLQSGKIDYPIRDKFLDNEEDDKSPAAKKAMIPTEWLTLVTPSDPIYEAHKGEVGATAETGGRLIYRTGGEAAFGISKDDYHEMYFWFNKPYEKLSGRWGFQRITGSPEYTKVPVDWWMANKVYVDQKPYILDHGRESVEAKARREGIKKMVYSPELLRILSDDPQGKQWLGSVAKDKLDATYQEYAQNKGEWNK